MPWAEEVVLGPSDDGGCVLTATDVLDSSDTAGARRGRPERLHHRPGHRRADSWSEHHTTYVAAGPAFWRRDPSTPVAALNPRCRQGDSAEPPLSRQRANPPTR